MISLVKAEQPDIAVFVEVSRLWAKELAVLSEMFPYSSHLQESDRFGSAIYSKLPLENASIKAFSKQRKSLFADVKFQDKIISLILVHPTVPIKQQSFIERNRQLAAIGEYAAQVKNPLIVLGDFNTTMWSPFYKNMVKTAKLRNARSGFGILPTWPLYAAGLYSDRSLSSQQRNWCFEDSYSPQCRFGSFAVNYRFGHLKAGFDIF